MLDEFLFEDVGDRSDVDVHVVLAVVGRNG